MVGDRPRLRSQDDRSTGHEALLELLDLGDDVEALKVTLAKMWHRLGDGDCREMKRLAMSCLRWSARRSRLR
jgi:hypothetical protein